MRIPVPFSLAANLSIALAAAAALGCTSIPRGAASVDDVTLQGNDALSDSDIEEKLATTPSPKFFGLFRGVMYEYELFDRGVLQRDLERVERYYRARGYYEARARAGRVSYTSDNHVEVTIEVEEGLPVLVRDARIDGLGGLSAKVARAVRAAMRRLVKTGKPFEEEPFKKAEEAMKRALTDSGYAWAKVERRADVDLPGHYARLFFSARPGPKATFGPVRIEGLGDLPEAPVRRALDISQDEAYSTADLSTAQQAVLNLGTFSAVEIKPDLADPPPEGAVVPLLVRVQRQKLKSVLLGGGVEIDSLRTEAHLHAGWEHKNLFGGFRHFMVDFKPGADLYPTRLPKFQKPTDVLPEERLRAEFRQPGFLEARTNGVISQELNAYPWLLPTDVYSTTDVPGYLEYKGSIGLDRTLWKLFGAPSYNVQWNNPFAYKGMISSTLHSVVISYVDLLAHFDFRDDTIRPHEGFYIQNDVQFAGIGGNARDVRIQPEVRGYVPIGKKVTLAARASVGFLFPMNYSKSNQQDPENYSPEDLQIIALRGFFSGGPSSNRGYPLRGVSPYGRLPYLSPNCAKLPDPTQTPDPTKTSGSPDPCRGPTGGLSLWEASLELRFPLIGALSGSTFCDTSDVSLKRVDIRFDHPHLSCGGGLRYDTPIGPVRLDIGYRITDPNLDGVQAKIYGVDVPLAFAFGIGEAF